MDDSLEERFRLAAQCMRTNTTIKLSNDQKLEIYALFKQATEGCCHTSRPGLFDFTGRAKWDAWHNLGNLSQAEARSSYIALVDRLDPGWENKKAESREAGPSGSSSTTGSQLGGPVVSKLAHDNKEEVPNDSKTVFDWCKEGNKEMLEKKAPGKMNQTDDQGMALIHWACDRGHLQIVEYLLTNGADINLQDGEGQTALHYACSCGHVDVIKCLLSRGIDKEIRDDSGELAENMCESLGVKALFSKATT